MQLDLGTAKKAIDPATFFTTEEIETGEIKGSPIRRMAYGSRLADYRRSLAAPTPARPAPAPYIPRRDRHLVEWLNETTTIEPTAKVSMRELFQAYSAARIAAGGPPITSSWFGRALLRLRPMVAKGQRGAARTWHYVGITLNAPAEAAGGPEA